MTAKARTIRSLAKPRATSKLQFIESMECLPVAKLPEGPQWSYEIKLDGYRLEALKEAKETRLYSRRANLLNAKFPYLAAALSKLPNATILDGEVVALDANRRSGFNLLQKFRSAETHIHYYAFDILVLRGRELLQLPLDKRREILADVLPTNEHISLSVVDHRPLAHMLKFATKHHLEGIIAKRADSVYEPGKRTGLWSKHRIEQGQEFVIGGYTPGSNGFDALIVGFYQGKDLLFASRVRGGFIPATRREVFAKIKHLKTSKCPFAQARNCRTDRFRRVDQRQQAPPHEICGPAR
jgi:ATP-dependent DNA ligase